MSRSGCAPNHLGQGLAQFLNANGNASGNGNAAKNGAESPARGVAPVKAPKSQPAGEVKADAVSDAAMPNPAVPALVAAAVAAKPKAKKNKTAKKAVPFPALSPAPAPTPAPAPAAQATGADTKSPASPAVSAAEDAADWKEAKDPASGKTYWYNRKTKATTWNCPHKGVAAGAARKQQTPAEVEADAVQVCAAVDYSSARAVLIRDPHMAKLMALIDAELTRLMTSQVASNSTISALHADFEKRLATPNLTPEMLISELKQKVDRALDAANAFVLARSAGEGANTTDVNDALPTPQPAAAASASASAGADAKGAAEAKVQTTDGVAVGGSDELPFGAYPALHMTTEAMSRPDGVKSAVQVNTILAEVKELMQNAKGEFYNTACQLHEPLQSLAQLLTDHALAPMDAQAAAVIGLIQQYVRVLLTSELRLMFRDARAHCTRLKQQADDAFAQYEAAEPFTAEWLALGEAMCKRAIVAMERNRALRAVGKSKDYAELVMTDKLGAAATAARRKWDERNEELKLYARQHEHDTVAVATRHGSTNVLLKARAQRTARQLDEATAELKRLDAAVPATVWTSPACAVNEVERQRCLHGCQQAIARLEISKKSEEIAVQLNDARFAGQTGMLTRAGDWVVRAQAAWALVGLAVEIAQRGIQDEMDKRMEQLRRDTVELERELVTLHTRVYVAFNRRRIQMKNQLHELRLETSAIATVMDRAKKTGQVKVIDAQKQRLKAIEIERTDASEEHKSRTAMLAELDGEPDLEGLLLRTRQPHPRDIDTGIPDITDDAYLLEPPKPEPLKPAAPVPAAAGAAGAAGAVGAGAAPHATPAKSAAVAVDVKSPPSGPAMAGGPAAAASPARVLPPAASTAACTASAGAAAAAGQTEGGIGDSVVVVDQTD